LEYAEVPVFARLGGQAREKFLLETRLKNEKPESRPSNDIILTLQLTVNPLIHFVIYQHLNFLPNDR
jgi:hypothetical protein